MANDLSHQPQRLVDLYRRLLDTFTDLTRQAGITVRPHGDGPLHYSALPPAAQARVVEQFAAYR